MRLRFDTWLLLLVLTFLLSIVLALLGLDDTFLLFMLVLWGILFFRLANHDRHIIKNPHAAWHNYRALFAYARGNHERGIIFASRAIELAPDYALAYMQRGTGYVYKHEHSNALADFQQAIDINPNQKVAYLMRGQSYAFEGKLGEALTDFDSAADLGMDKSMLYFFRGTALLQNKHHSDALEDLQQAYQLNKIKHSMLLGNLGNALLHNGQYDEGMGYINQAIKKQPSGAVLFNNRAFFRSHKGELQEALTDVNHAMDLQADIAYFYGTRGHVYWLMGDYEASLSDFQQAAQLSHDDKAHMVGQALAYYKLEQTDEALKLWQSAISASAEAEDADTFQDNYHFAEPFYQAMLELEGLADTSSATE